MKLLPKRRTIVEPKALAEELTRCGVSARKLDSLTTGLTNTICVNPEVFRREDQSGWSRVIINDYPPDIPAIRIWFTFDDDHIYVERVDLLSEFL